MASVSRAHTSAGDDSNATALANSDISLPAEVTGIDFSLDKSLLGDSSLRISCGEVAKEEEGVDSQLLRESLNAFFRADPQVRDVTILIDEQLSYEEAFRVFCDRLGVPDGQGGSTERDLMSDLGLDPRETHPGAFKKLELLGQVLDALKEFSGIRLTLELHHFDGELAQLLKRIPKLEGLSLVGFNANDSHLRDISENLSELKRLIIVPQNEASVGITSDGLEYVKYLDEVAFIYDVSWHHSEDPGSSDGSHFYLYFKGFDPESSGALTDLLD